ncbi:hypothetical protein B0H12DRAFT_1172763 [Mycena haematopus]|nr:hypothetical protein B0H12DRAFT_1172763 [Mycena haematopus]
MDPNASFSSPHSRYQTERCRTHPHFPNPTDKAACARFRLARRRRASAQAAPALPQSPPAADSVELWRQILSLHENFNELSSLAAQARPYHRRASAAARLSSAAAITSHSGGPRSRPISHSTALIWRRHRRHHQTSFPLVASEFHSPSYPRSMRSGEDIRLTLSS